MSNSNIKDYYYILGLNKNATKDEIKTAYRKLSMKFHPDQNQGDKFFEERFKDLHEAYETLVDDDKRRTYDYISKEKTTTEEYFYNTASEPPPGQSKSTYTTQAVPKKTTKQFVFAVLGILLFLSPFILGAIKRLIERKDAQRGSTISSYQPLTSTAADTNSYTSPATSGASGGDATAGTSTLNSVDYDPQSKFRDDEGLSAENVVSYFLNALNSADCNTAWNLMYNTTWVSNGKDWFCSSSAFGTVTKVSVTSIAVIKQELNDAIIYVNYYAEDSYNGNKCFKQNIFVQRLAYTDNKSRWKITKMQDAEPPFYCSP